MRRPCANCPWRMDAPRRHWDPTHFTEIWHGCQDDGTHEMLCHKSKGKKDPKALVCQGWVRVMGEQAIGVRIVLIRGRVTPEELLDRGGPKLFRTFAAMLRANGIDIPPRNRYDYEKDRRR